MNNDLEEVYKCIPNREPFLFIDKIISKTDKQVITEYKVNPDNYFFKGHFPGHPFMPGVILCENCFQSCIILLGSVFKTIDKGFPVVTKIIDCKFKKVIVPNDILTTTINLDSTFSYVAYMSGTIYCKNKLALKIKFQTAFVDYDKILESIE